MKEKNYWGLCMRYGSSCKLCPRNKKCDEELALEKRDVRYESENIGNGIQNSNERRRKRLSNIKRR